MLIFYICIINHSVTCFFNNIFYPIFIYYQTFLQLLKMILSFLVSKSRITEGFRRDSLAKYEQVRDDDGAGGAVMMMMMMMMMMVMDASFLLKS